MKNIGGNLDATIQIKASGVKNAIGERVNVWNSLGSVLGWLDYAYASIQNSVNQFDSRLQDTSHVFLCDYDLFKTASQGNAVTSTDSRLLIDGSIYEVLMIDDVMNLHEHLEIYLKYIGGGLGV